jgi:hypothetical protein
VLPKENRKSALIGSGKWGRVCLLAATFIPSWVALAMSLGVDIVDYDKPGIALVSLLLIQGSYLLLLITFDSMLGVKERFWFGLGAAFSVCTMALMGNYAEYALKTGAEIGILGVVLFVFAQIVNIKMWALHVYPEEKFRHNGIESIG